MIAAVRYLILVSGGAPPTIDAGNWLAFGEGLVGDDLRAGSVYPPVVPMLVVGAVGVIGPLHAVALIGAAASVAPAGGVYVVLREHGLRWPAVVLAGLLAPASATGEATAWGGYPQLLGAGLALWFLARLDRALRTNRRRDALIAGVLLAATFATSHLAAAVAAVAGSVIAAAHLGGRTVSGAHRARRGHVHVLGLVVLPTLPLLPVYTGLVDGFSSRSVAAGGPDVSPAALVGQLEFLHRDLAVPWRALLLSGLAVLVLLFDQRRSPLWLVSAGPALAAFGLATAAGEPRFLFFVPPAALVALGLWWKDVEGRPGAFFRRARFAAGLFLGITLAAQTVTGLAFFPEQRAYYGILSPGTVVAIDFLRTETAGDSLVAVSPVREAPLGWWVEGLARRRTLYATPLRWLNFPDEQERARVANEIFAPSFPRPGAFDLACESGVDYILVDKSWGGFDARVLDRLARDVPGLVVHDNPDAAVLRPRCPDLPA